MSRVDPDVFEVLEDQRVGPEAVETSIRQAVRLDPA
jgi:hypothetical protein